MKWVWILMASIALGWAADLPGQDLEECMFEPWLCHNTTHKPED